MKLGNVFMLEMYKIFDKARILKTLILPIKVKAQYDLIDNISSILEIVSTNFLESTSDIL